MGGNAGTVVYLPNEILLHIVDAVHHNDADDLQTLRNLRLASKITSRFATPYLFETVKLHATAEMSIAQMQGLVKSGLGKHVRDIMITDMAIFPLEMRASVNNKLAIPRIGDKEIFHQKGAPLNHFCNSFLELEDIALRFEGIKPYYRNELRPEPLQATLDHIDQYAAFSVRIMLHLWRLIQVCRENLRALRLRQHKAHIVPTITAEDMFILIIFHTLERFDLPSLRILDLRLFNTKSFKHLTPHIRVETVQIDGEEQYLWDINRLYGNLSRLQGFEIAGIWQHDYPREEFQALDDELSFARKEVFLHIKNLTNIVVKGSMSLTIFHLLDNLWHLTSFQLIGVVCGAGTDLQHVFQRMVNLEKLVMDNVHLYLPDKEDEYFNPDYKLEEQQPESRKAPWFVLFRQCVVTMERLTDIFFQGLEYMRDPDQDMWHHSYITESGYLNLLRSRYMHDHIDLKNLRGIVIARRDSLGLPEDEDLRCNITEVKVRPSKWITHLNWKHVNNGQPWSVAYDEHPWIDCFQSSDDE